MYVQGMNEWTMCARSQIRAGHFKELKKFFSIPSHFRGLSDLFSIFKQIFSTSTTQLIDAYEKGEEMFTQMMEHARRFQEWVITGVIGCFENVDCDEQSLPEIANRKWVGFM